MPSSLVSSLQASPTELDLRNNKQILHATALDIKVYYYPRNIVIPRVVINLISNTVKVFIILITLHTKPCQGYEDRNEAFF